jgi:hypothetical protein
MSTDWSAVTLISAILGVDWELDYARRENDCCRVREFCVSTRFTAEELRQLEATAKVCRISRAELIRARSLGKIMTTHEQADWAESELAKRIRQRAARGERGG